jgi:fibro-slime domain-containing protein
MDRRRPLCLAAWFGGPLACSPSAVPPESGQGVGSEDAGGVVDGGAPDADAKDSSAPDGSITLPVDATVGPDAGGEECEEANTILAVVRDHRGWGGSAGPRHPDFEGTFNGYQGVVQATLGADQKPVYAAAGSTPATTGKAEFDQWYRDTEGVNLRFEVSLPIAEDPGRPGVYVYDNQDFFPIDDLGWDESFGHNFHFTTEIHLSFQYTGGEFFTFRGDDDLFLFINGRLAIDLGGVHPAEEDSVNLDEDAATLGITPGGTYAMDIFHAERHTTFSTFRIETSLRCVKNVVVR